MDDVAEKMWTGGTQPNHFPHRCPYRRYGASEKECVELSGTNIHQNKEGCCGTFRSTVNFGPCNSKARRCIKCLEIGLRRFKANAVTDANKGTCDEHAGGVIADAPRESRLAADPRLGITASRVTVANNPVSFARVGVLPGDETPDSPQDEPTDEAEGSIAGTPEDGEDESSPAAEPLVEEPKEVAIVGDVEFGAGTGIEEIKDTNDMDPLTLAEKVKSLDPRTYEIFVACGKGLNNTQIADELNLNVGIVQNVLSNKIYMPFGLSKLGKLEKRRAIITIYTRLVNEGLLPPAPSIQRPTLAEVVEEETGPSPESAPIPSPQVQPTEAAPSLNLTVLGMRLNDLIDEAEATLKAIGGKRRPRSGSG